MTALNDLNALQASIAEAVLGQDEVIRQIIVGLLANGHLLLESLPGLAKTRTVKALARHLDAQMSRIQFTPDLLPSDITGAEVLHQVDGQNLIRFQPGPLFGNLILADEINRAPAKVQAALLEAMEERQITVAGNSHPLPELFIVLATQNPIEQEGTYPLPEAQIDRFMLKVVVGYPNRAEERAILDRFDHTDSAMTIAPVTDPADILAARRIINTIYMDDKIKDYIVALVYATREPQSFNLELKEYIETGASPRATINLKAVARCLAYLAGRGYVTPDDVKASVMDVMRHRLRISYEAEAEGISSEDIIRKILDTVPVP